MRTRALLKYWINKYMIKKLDKVYNWFKIVERNESILMIDYLIKGVGALNTKKVLGINIGFEKYVYLNRNIYWDAEEAKEVADFFNEIIKEKGASYLQRFIKKWIKLGTGLLLLSKKLGEDDNAKKTSKQLLKDFIKFSNQNWEFSTALLIPVAIQGDLLKKIEGLLDKRGLSEDKKKKYSIVLTSPEKENSSTKELVSFYSLISLLQRHLAENNWTEDNIRQALSKKDLSSGLKKYLSNFSWIGARWYIGDGWSEEDFIERAAKQDLGEDYKRKAVGIERLVKENRKETLRIIKELKLSAEEGALVKAAKEYVFLRTYRTDVFNQAGFVARPFLKEIAKRLGISFEELIYLTADEVSACLQKGRIEKNLLSRIGQRKVAFGALLYNNKLSAFEGSDIEEFKKQQKIVDAQDIMPAEGLRGMIASPGKVVGKVRIVDMDKKGLSQVEKGDILVTSMTTPDFVPAMEKAAAFVTNEGGITCHAAIVSREMKKPCIIGTKIATKVLRDGDLVEVDSDKGIVRIIKKAERFLD